MKKYLVFLFFLGACAGKDSKTSTDTSTDTTKASVNAVKPVTIDSSDTTNSSDLASVSKNPYKLGNIEVASTDLGDPNTWDMAKARADGIGNGWRLPTDQELKEIYKNKKEIGGFSVDVYWSSEEKDMMNAHTLNFSNGAVGSFSKIYNASIRVVRSL